jgi:hypothetical protein
LTVTGIVHLFDDGKWRENFSFVARSHQLFFFAFYGSSAVSISAVFSGDQIGGNDKHSGANISPLAQIRIRRPQNGVARGFILQKDVK